MESLEINAVYDPEVPEITVRCRGFITSANAGEFQAQVDALLEEYPGAEMTMDFDGIDGITSAGLRVLLHAKKINDRLRVINASPVVYETFEVTGFSSLFSVSRQPRTVSVEGCEKIAQGAAGAIYRLDEDNIVKVFMPDESIHTIRLESETARKAFLYGIPTAISFGTVRVGDCYGIQYEMIKARSFASVLKGDPDNFDSHVKDYTALLRQLHTTKDRDGVFVSMKEIYHEAIDYSAKYFEADEVKKFKALIDSIPDRDTLIHGDFHPGNIMASGDGLMLIDLTRMGVGHPIFDLFEMAASHINLATSTPEIAEAFLGIPPETIIRLWKETLKQYFPDKTEEEIARIEKQLMGYGRIANVIAPYIGQSLTEEQVLFYINEAKTHLVPIIDGLIGSVDW